MVVIDMEAYKMQKKWVKWVAAILAAILLLTSIGAVGFSIFAGR